MPAATLARPTPVRPVLSRPALDAVRAQFTGGAGYLAACTAGLPPRAAQQAVLADVLAAGSGRPDIAGYCSVVEQTRRHFARLIGVAPSRVAIGSQTSVLAGLVATAVPDGGEVLCPEGDFSSIVLPFVHAGRGIRVRCVPLAALASSIRPQTALVAFSIVQSATGEVADAAAIVAAARRHGARTLCDTTQATGWLPVDGAQFDAVVCHAYKWLCAPRGVAFLAISERLQREVRPLFAGWYAGADPWDACYGDSVALATDASALDVSPAWQAFVGAEPALRMFAGLDPDELYRHATGLAAAFRERLGLGQSEHPSAIVTWCDPDGHALARLTAAGITASGRAGRVRVAFHVFNDHDDVERAATALGR